MDELEMLKKDWKKKENSFNQISEKEIYGMLHKRSSSIVKWILIISILEIAFWTLLSFVTTDDDYAKRLEMLHLKQIIQIMNYVNYVVIFFFIFKFYMNYRKINATDSIKQLMKSIINTRKTVKYYIWYNLGMIFFSFVLVFIFTIKYDPLVTKSIESITENMNENAFYTIAFLFFLVITLAITTLFWLFYRLIYGVLLKRLNINYQELKKLEI